MLPLLLFIIIIGSIVGRQVTSESGGGLCEFTSDITFNEKLEAKRKYVEKSAVYKDMVNVILGIYAKEGYSNLNTIINVINKASVLMEENEKKISKESYIQYYKYGDQYLEYLIKNSYSVSVKVNKEYQRLIGDDSEDYKYYLSVLSFINTKCSSNVDGLPLNKPYIISGWFPFYEEDGTGEKHYGIDFGVAIGTDVFSVGDGEVVESNAGCPFNDGYLGNKCGIDKGYFGAGNFVFLKIAKDGSDYYVMYCHLKDVHVKKGDFVFSGMKVGTSGHSGNSSGAHLHFEIHKNSLEIGNDNGIVNPCDFVNELCDL